MDFGQLWLLLQGVLPIDIVGIIQLILMGLGALVVMGYTYIKITPTQDDDAWWAKMEGIPILGGFMKWLVKFAPIQRKE